MTTRWWAPGTDVDLEALLVGGGDAEADLGLVLMAGHKAGASALQNVAKSMVCSESALVAGLNVARREVAPRMVDAIAPITGATYAGLLVRDVLDDADQGALDVYRSAVSKGVAPPIAMERAAAGYGVPTKEMGVFASVAADPKANPRAVEDAADRSLMTYVSKVAAQEAVTEVSKAETAAAATATETDFDPAEHPRGPDGRFVDVPDAPAPVSALERIRQRLGLSSREPSAVGATRTETAPKPTLKPVKEKTPAVQRREARARRAIAQRKAQTARAKAPTAQPARATAQRKASRAKVERKNLHALADRLNTTFKGQLEQTKGLTVLPDLLHKIPDRSERQYYDIGQPVVIGAGQVAGASIRMQAADQAMTQIDPSRQIFRIGHLVEQARYVEQDLFTSGAHQRSAQVEVAASPVEYASPVVKTVGHDELGEGEREDKIYVENKRKKMVTRDIAMPSGDLRPVVDYEELGNVLALPVYEPIDTAADFDDMGRPVHHHQDAIALVHFQPADPNRPMDRAMPLVEEYVILTDARGTLEGTGRHVDVALDPNQIYEVVNAPDVSPLARVAPERMWDLDNEVIVNRWYLRPVHETEIGDIIEGVDKALSAAEVATFNRLHPRDAEGQFAETSAPARPKAKGVAQRKKRAKQVQRLRQVRGGRLKPVQAQTAQPARAKARMKPAVRSSHPVTSLLDAKIQARAKRREEQGLPAMPVLSDARAYKVFSEKDFQALMAGVPLEDFVDMHGGEPIQLGSFERRTLAEARDTHVDSLPGAMALNVGEEIQRQMIPRDVLDEIPFGAVVDFDYLAERINHVMETRPSYDLFEISTEPDTDQIFIYGAKVSGSFQNVIEFEHELDMTGPLQLTFIGEYRAADVLAKGEEGAYSLVSELAELDLDHDGAIPNPVVHYYRLTSPPVRRFRMDNS